MGHVDHRCVIILIISICLIDVLMYSGEVVILFRADLQSQNVFWWNVASSGKMIELKKKAIPASPHSSAL